MTPQPVVWHGSQDESVELLQALNKHCACSVSMHGVRTAICPSHQLLSSQRALDGFLFGRHLSARLREEEFRVSSAPVGFDEARLHAAMGTRSSRQVGAAA